MQTVVGLPSGITVQDVLKRWPETLTVFLEFHVPCVGCCVAGFHTIPDACAEHDVDEATFRAALLAAMAQQSPPAERQ